MASEIVNIAVCSIPWCFQRNKVEDMRYFYIMKAKEGRWLANPMEYPEKIIGRFTKRGWLKFHNEKYYIVKTVDVLPLDGQYTHAKIPVEALDDPKLFKAMLFLIGYAYLMSPQAQREITSRKRRKPRTAQVNESKHLGGISHSICMKFFGFKRTWCSNMRRLCEQMGLAKWDRRWVEVPLQKPHGTIPLHVADALMGGNGKYRLQNGNVEEEVTAMFTPARENILHIPYEYRSIVKFHYS